MFQTWIATWKRTQPKTDPVALADWRRQTGRGEKIDNETRGVTCHFRPTRKDCTAAPTTQTTIRWGKTSRFLLLLYYTVATTTLLGSLLSHHEVLVSLESSTPCCLVW